MRKFHRWIMTVMAVLLAYWVCSGLWLAVVDVTDARKGWSNDGGGPGSVAPTQVGGVVIATAGSFTADDVAHMTANVLKSARREVPDTPIAAVELTAPNGVPQATVTFDSPTSKRLLFNATTGELILNNVPAAPPGNDPADSLHSRVKNWHRGTVGADANSTLAPGNVLALLAGATLFLLSVTGIVMYLDLWRRRRHTGQSKFFWS